MSAVCEAARNVACTGARPAAVTNCLNFGNPENPEVGYELAEAIEGMALACEALGLPVVSGNVSLYNEHMGGSIYPTPVIGVVGVLEDASWQCRAGFRDEGDDVFLLGDGTAAIDGSEYQKVGAAAGGGPHPRAQPDERARAAPVLADAAGGSSCEARTTSSDGGLAVALASRRSLGGIGVTRRRRRLFGEGEGRVLVSAPSAGGCRALLAGGHAGVAVRSRHVSGGDEIQSVGAHWRSRLDTARGGLGDSPDAMGVREEPL